MPPSGAVAQTVWGLHPRAVAASWIPWTVPPPQTKTVMPARNESGPLMPTGIAVEPPQPSEGGAGRRWSSAAQPCIPPPQTSRQRSPSTLCAP